MNNNIKSKINIAVVLPCSINRDSRARRSIKEMSKYGLIDVFYIKHSPEDNKIEGEYSSNVTFYPIRKRKSTISAKIIQHSFFYLTYSYFIKLIISKNIRYDIIYCHDLVSGYIGAKLKQKFNCKFIYDVHDLYIETLNQYFPIKKNGKMNLKHFFLFKLMSFIGRKFENKIINKADLTFTVNESCMNFLRDEYNNKHVLYFRNFPEFKNIPKNNYNLSDKLSISADKNITIYIGGIATGRHLRNIVDSAKYLNDNNVIVIIGDGVLKDELIRRSKYDNTINNKIFFLNLIPYDDLFDTINEAQLGLMILNPINKSKEYAFANKVSEYMLCGIPPLLSNHIEHKNILKDDDIGFIIEDYKAKDIANKINEIFKDSTLLSKKSILARKKFEEKYNWDIEKKEFLDPFKKLLNDCNY